MRLLAVFFVLCIMTFALYPGQGAEDIMDISLDDLLNAEITVASKSALTPRETPGIVSVITREDIMNSGARDLIDALTLLVPGINFAVDVEGAVGLSMRGMWAYEGKVLLMMDGQECNEDMFSNTLFGNHYPLENVEKIEIIRGPGSAIYGGYAGVGVINIITRGVEREGVYANLLQSRMNNQDSHKTVSLGFAKKFGDLGVSVNGTLSTGARSDRDYVDYYGDSLTMKGNSELNTSDMNMNVQYKGLDFRAILHQYRTTQIDLWDAYYRPGAVEESWDDYLLNLKYTFKVTKNLTLTPEWKLKIQFPWQLVTPDQGYTNEKRSEKMHVGLFGIWNITPKSNMVFGFESFKQNLILPDEPSVDEELFKTGENQIGYTNYAAYAQFMLFTKAANITVGGRFDYSDEYGSSFVPRVGLTRAWKRFHVKAMASQSFRIPGGIIPNRIPVGADNVTPEKANNLELELGYRLSDTMMLTLNAYDVTFNKVIVYQIDADSTMGSYYNSGKFGSRGLEAEFRYMGKKSTLAINYSFYTVSENNVAIYSVPGHDNTFLAFPNHRLNVLAGYKFDRTFSVHPSLSYFGQRYGFVGYDDATESHILKTFDPTVVFNINFRAKNVLADGIDLTLGVRDLFDSKYSYIQAYNGWHAPLPAPSRSVYLRIAYSK